MGGANQKNTALMLWDGGGEPTWYLVIVTGSRVGILNKVIMISPDNKEKEKKNTARVNYSQLSRYSPPDKRIVGVIRLQPFKCL